MQLQSKKGFIMIKRLVISIVIFNAFSISAADEQTVRVLLNKISTGEMSVKDTIRNLLDIKEEADKKLANCNTLRQAESEQSQKDLAYSRAMQSEYEQKYLVECQKKKPYIGTKTAVVCSAIFGIATGIVVISMR